MSHRFKVHAFIGLLFISGLHQAWGGSIEIMSYNVENLFDAIDDPNTQDEEFTPDAPLHWTAAKVAWKIQKIAEVIQDKTPQGVHCPDILTLMEIENPGVLVQLRDHGLAQCNYKVTIAEARSADPRGIRVAILSRIPLLSRPTIIVPYTGARSTIEAHFNIAGRPLIVFANHWKSRRVMGDSTDNGETKRQAAARAVFRRISQLREENSELEFVVAGDMNDEPENLSIAQEMHVAYKPLNELEDGFLFWDPSIELRRFLALPQFEELNANQQDAVFRKIRGTYYYAKEHAFNQLDHLLLSASLFDDQGLRYKMNSYEVVRRKGFISQFGGPLPFNAKIKVPELEDGEPAKEPGETVILETETGPVGPENQIIQGASDHFPIRLRLEYAEGS